MNIKEKYEKEVKPSLTKKFSIENSMAVPKIEKVVLNVGLGGRDEKLREESLKNLVAITGQKPNFRTAKKAIASFKTRKGQEIGLAITLRRKKMYDFLDKLVGIVLPRVRDFRGVSEKSFDSKGNYSLGFRELNVFPEIEYSKSERPSGLQVTIVTTAKNDEQSKELLEGIGIPFRKVNK